MDVKGKHLFNVSKQQLWEYLMDSEVLAKITPGVSKLEILDTDSYKTVSDIKIGPVKGSFKGKLKVVDKDSPNSFAIEMEQHSRIGNAHGRIEMNLADADSQQSELSFKGKAKLSGVIARTGQRVLSGVANTITREVFASLEKHIEEDAIKLKTEKKTIAATKIEEEPTKATKTVAAETSGFWAWLRNFFKKLFGG